MNGKTNTPPILHRVGSRKPAPKATPPLKHPTLLLIPHRPPHSPPKQPRQHSIVGSLRLFHLGTSLLTQKLMEILQMKSLSGLYCVCCASLFFLFFVLLLVLKTNKQLQGHRGKVESVCCVIYVLARLTLQSTFCQIYFVVICS